LSFDYFCKQSDWRKEMTQLSEMLKQIEASSPTAKYDWIVSMVNSGKTVYFQTSLRTTKFQKKHLSLLKTKLENGVEHIYISGIDYTHTKMTARQD
jgi:hypothetical protein